MLSMGRWQTAKVGARAGHINQSVANWVDNPEIAYAKQVTKTSTECIETLAFLLARHFPGSNGRRTRQQTGRHRYSHHGANQDAA